MEGGGKVDRGGRMEIGGKNGGRGQAWKEGGRMEGRGRDAGMGEGEGRALIAARGSGHLECCCCCSHRLSSPFVVVAQQLRPSLSFIVDGGRRSSLGSSSGHIRLSVVVVVICVCGCLSSFVAGWAGRSSSPVGLPGLWAVVLWSLWVCRS